MRGNRQGTSDGISAQAQIDLTNNPKLETTTENDPGGSVGQT